MPSCNLKNYDPYFVLGITANTSDHAIKRRFIGLRRQYINDLKMTESQYIIVQSSYTVLVDHELRKAFDDAVVQHLSFSKGWEIVEAIQKRRGVVPLTDMHMEIEDDKADQQCQQTHIDYEKNLQLLLQKLDDLEKQNQELNKQANLYKETVDEMKKTYARSIADAQTKIENTKSYELQWINMKSELDAEKEKLNKEKEVFKVNKLEFEKEKQQFETMTKPIEIVVKENLKSDI